MCSVNPHGGRKGSYKAATAPSTAWLWRSLGRFLMLLRSLARTSGRAMTIYVYHVEAKADLNTEFVRG